jgi:hypothetical protein
VDERGLLELASGQDGLVTAADAARFNVSRRIVDRRLAVGEWSRAHRLVYRITGAPPTLRQALRAACLSLGDEAAVSHRAAAALWGMARTDQHWLEVSIVRARSQTLSGVTVHRSGDLRKRWVTTKDGLRCTDPHRTLVDLGAVWGPAAVERALDRALGRQLVSVRGLRVLLDEVGRKGRSGVGVLRGLLDARGDDSVTAGVLEARMLSLLRRFDVELPVPEFVVIDDGRFVGRVDFAYPEVRLAIELDGFEAHTSLESFRHDRVRQNDLVNAGWTVLRYVWRDVEDQSPAVARGVVAALSRRRTELESLRVA